jgi:hypothetical protein
LLSSLPDDVLEISSAQRRALKFRIVEDSRFANKKVSHALLWCRFPRFEKAEEKDSCPSFFHLAVQG